MGERIFKLETTWDLLCFIHSGPGDDDRSFWIEMLFATLSVNSRRDELMTEVLSPDVIKKILGLLVDEIKKDAENLSGGRAGTAYKSAILKGNGFLEEVCKGIELCKIPATWIPPIAISFGSLINVKTSGSPSGRN